MIDPWGLVIVLALGCAYLIWYGLRMGWRLHEAQIKIALLRDGARPARYSADRHCDFSEESFAAEFKLGCVAPDGSIWAAPNLRHTQGLVAVVEGERDKAEFFGWERAGWDGKDQRDLMRRN